MNKKIYAVLLFLVLVLSISTASAADLGNQSQDNVLQNDNQVTSNGIEPGNVSITNFNDLNDAIDTSSDGVVNISNNIVREDGESSISISKNIIINGNGYTIDGNYKATSMFVITGSNITVILNNLNIINAKDGAINLGAGNILLVNSCNFTNNTADKGGAINNNGNLTVDNCFFINNTAQSMGAGIYNQKDALVNNSVFSGNDIIIRNNSNDYGGAAIYNVNLISNLIIDNSRFANNILNYKNGDLLDGVVTSFGELTISNSEFTNNSGRWGGAVSTLYYDIPTPNSLNIVNTNFNNNIAIYGGAVFNEGF